MQAERWLLVLWSWFFGVVLSASAEEAFSLPSAVREADHWEQEGIELVRSGEWLEGMAMMMKAVTLDPENPRRRASAGSLAFDVGRSLVGSSDPRMREQAMQFFRVAEEELTRALETASGGDPGEPRKIPLAHVHFLLGDLHRHVRHNEEGAREHYEAALELDPAHAGATAALRRADEMAKSQDVPLVPDTPGSERSGDSIRFDGRTLNLAMEKTADDRDIAAYVPEGESLEEWTLLVTRTHYHSSGEPSALAAAFKESLAEAGGIVVEEKTLEDGSLRLALLAHRAGNQVSEFSLWHIVRGEDRLTGYQATRRFEGPDHVNVSTAAATRLKDEWAAQLTAAFAGSTNRDRSDTD